MEKNIINETPRGSLGAEKIFDERIRQQVNEDCSLEDDDQFKNAELLVLALAYITYPMEYSEKNNDISEKTASNFDSHDLDYIDMINLNLDPRLSHGLKPDINDRISDLVKAGALIAAEIDRRLRLKKI